MGFLFLFHHDVGRVVFIVGRVAIVKDPVHECLGHSFLHGQNGGYYLVY